MAYRILLLCLELTGFCAECIPNISKLMVYDLLETMLVYGQTIVMGNMDPDAARARGSSFRGLRADQ
jgi:hypothetical protein